MSTRNSLAGSGMSESIKIVVLLIAVIAVFFLAYHRIKASMPVSQKAAVASVVVASVPVDAVVKPPVPTYSLTGVIDAGDNSIAIINGKLLKIDGTIDNLMLKKIFPKEVELLNIKDNQSVFLRIN
jgi:hypothetical protein